MRNVKLTFENGAHLDSLIGDASFMTRISYLCPVRLSATAIALTDPIVEHGRLDSEAVVLTQFADAISRIIFPATDNPIEFQNPNATGQKGGLHHNGQVIINSTDVNL